MAKGNELIKGGIYRLFTQYANGTKEGKQSSHFLDVICDDAEYGTGTIIKCEPDKLDGISYIGGDWFVGGKQSLNCQRQLVAKDLESYNYSMPVLEKEVVVEKEVIVEKEIIVNINKYEDTLIDHLYNYYCKIKNRVFNDEFV